MGRGVVNWGQKWVGMDWDRPGPKKVRACGNVSDVFT